MHGIIYRELVHGVVTDESRAALPRGDGPPGRAGAQAILLACTEIDLLVGGDDASVPVYDTTALHCAVLTDFMITGEIGHERAHACPCSSRTSRACSSAWPACSAAAGSTSSHSPSGRPSIPEVSRITILVSVEGSALEQVTKQLNKLINVLKIVELEEKQAVQRELLLVKVRADETTRRDVLQIVELFQRQGRRRRCRRR